ncbi:hypothetical protein GCM10023107_15260 [Actinoplanes octamycinicus]|nr:hypothetical protein Aoc01nite_19190 [Actinoplanes octamycinicus]
MAESGSAVLTAYAKGAVGRTASRERSAGSASTADRERTAGSASTADRERTAGSGSTADRERTAGEGRPRRNGGAGIGQDSAARTGGSGSVCRTPRRWVARVTAT